jgi:hypothetical protein
LCLGQAGRHAPRRSRAAADARRCRAAPFPPAAAGGDALADSSSGDVSFDDVLPAPQQAATAGVEEGDGQVRRARGRVCAEGRAPQR